MHCMRIWYTMYIAMHRCICYIFTYTSHYLIFISFWKWSNKICEIETISFCMWVFFSRILYLILYTCLCVLQIRYHLQELTPQFIEIQIIQTNEWKVTCIIIVFSNIRENIVVSTLVNNLLQFPSIQKWIMTQYLRHYSPIQSGKKKSLKSLLNCFLRPDPCFAGHLK